MSALRDITKMLAPISRRMRLIVSRAVVRALDDAGGLQGLRIGLLAGETHERAERFQQYGLTSSPHAGAEGIALAVGGDRSHMVVIAVDDRRYRLTGLEGGEVALYDDLGHVVHLTREGVVIDGGGHAVTVINTPRLRVDGDIEATGQIRDLVDSGGKTMAGMRATFNSHTHGENDGGGNTDGPSAAM